MTRITDQFTRLQRETRAALAKDRRSNRAIAEGAGVNVNWLAKYRQGQFPKAEVAKVERVHRFLTKPDKRAA